MLYQLITGKNMCTLHSNWSYLNSLLLTICITQITSFETNMMLNHLRIQQF